MWLLMLVLILVFSAIWQALSGALSSSARSGPYTIAFKSMVDYHVFYRREVQEIWNGLNWIYSRGEVHAWMASVTSFIVSRR